MLHRWSLQNGGAFAVAKRRWLIREVHACHEEVASYELVASVLGVHTRSNNVTAADKEVVCLICLALLRRAAHVEHAG